MLQGNRKSRTLARLLMGLFTYTSQTCQETVEGHRTRNHSYCSILYTPISIPYKAYNGALLYWRWKCWGAAGSHKSKHLEYTAYFWKGNINNLAHFSWVITLSPPDLCFYPTGGLYKPCFHSDPWCIQV